MANKAFNTSVFSLAPHSIRMLRYGSYRADGGGRRVFAKNRDAPFDQAFGAQGRSRSKQNDNNMLAQHVNNLFMNCCKSFVFFMHRVVVIIFSGSITPSTIFDGLKRCQRFTIFLR